MYHPTAILFIVLALLSAARSLQLHHRGAVIVTFEYLAYFLLLAAFILSIRI